MLLYVLGIVGAALLGWEYGRHQQAAAPPQLPPGPAPAPPVLARGQDYLCDGLSVAQCNEVCNALSPATLDSSLVASTAQKYASYDIAYDAMQARLDAMGYLPTSAVHTGAVDLATQACLSAMLGHAVGMGGGGGHGGGGRGGGGRGGGGRGRGRGFGGGWGGPGWWGPGYVDEYVTPTQYVPVATPAAPTLDPLCTWALHSADPTTIKSLIAQHAAEPPVVACLSQRLAQLQHAGMV